MSNLILRVRQVVVLPFFVLLLLSSCREKATPVLGHDCFIPEEGQVLVDINDQVKLEYLSLMNAIEPSLATFALNKLYSTENMNTLVSVDLSGAYDQTIQLMDTVRALDSRKDGSNAHYLFKRKNFIIYTFVESQEDATVLFWNYSTDSTRIASQFAEESYYLKKFCKD